MSEQYLMVLTRGVLEDHVMRACVQMESVWCIIGCPLFSVRYFSLHVTHAMVLHAHDAMHAWMMMMMVFDQWVWGGEKEGSESMWDTEWMSEWVRKWERSGCFHFPPIVPTWNPRTCLAPKCPKDVGHVVSDGTSVLLRWVRGKCCCRSLLPKLNTHTLLLTWPSIFNMPILTSLFSFHPTLSFYTLHTYYVQPTLYTIYTLHSQLLQQR